MRVTAPLPMIETVKAHRVLSPCKLFLTEFGENRVAVVAAVVLGLIILLAVGAPLIPPQNPYDLASLVLTDARQVNADLLNLIKAANARVNVLTMSSADAFFTGTMIGSPDGG